MPVAGECFPAFRVECALVVLEFDVVSAVDESLEAKEQFRDASG